MGWQPDRLDKLLKILGERAQPVKWDKQLQDRWKARFDARADVTCNRADWEFGGSRIELTQGLPSYVTGVQAVTNYTSVDELEGELVFKPDPPEAMPYPGGAAVAILGHEFFVPDDPRWTHGV